ncbi:MAG: hypothetical protein KAS32_12155 [Candidatus Peribacteraceae bacterium]|nr:hypothetical protein [Candidatus Peribacteraceae bacterium]
MTIWMWIGIAGIAIFVIFILYVIFNSGSCRSGSCLGFGDDDFSGCGGGGGCGDGCSGGCGGE